MGTHRYDHPVTRWQGGWLSVYTLVLPRRPDVPVTTDVRWTAVHWTAMSRARPVARHGRRVRRRQPGESRTGGTRCSASPLDLRSTRREQLRDGAASELLLPDRGDKLRAHDTSGSGAARPQPRHRERRAGGPAQHVSERRSVVRRSAGSACQARHADQGRV